MVYDYAGAKIAKVEEFFITKDDRMEYIGVKTHALERFTLSPLNTARVNEQRQLSRALLLRCKSRLLLS